MKYFKSLTFLISLSTILILSSCGDDDLEEHNPEELIDQVTLTFTPDGGGTPIVVAAIDPDGEGPQDFMPEDSIRLNANTTYTLTLDLMNTEENESITAEIQAEAEEHLFFFGWTDGLFSNPVGDGNIDNRSDNVIYNDQDSNGQPLGISTTWTTNGAGNGNFRLVLKHQPDMKSGTSTVSDGETDVDLTFGVRIQ